MHSMQALYYYIIYDNIIYYTILSLCCQPFTFLPSILGL